jgi:hypothetical protein
MGAVWIMNRTVVVEESLLGGLQSSLDVLADDWRREGAGDVSILSHPKGVHLNPMDLRNKLTSIDDLEGALLIGELPVALMDDPSYAPAKRYMSEYFFMELKGNWTVSAENVVSSTDNQPPNICIGRVVLGPDTGYQLAATGNRPTEIEFYRRYLEKLHEFRCLSVAIEAGPNPAVALPPVNRFGFRAVIVDNVDLSPGIHADRLGHLYPCENIDIHQFANKMEYTDILKSTHDWLLLLAHSDPGGHQLADGDIWNPCDYLSADAKVNFFQFESCSVGSIVWVDQFDPVNPGILKLVSDPFVSNVLFTPTVGILMIAPSVGGYFGNVTVFYDKLHEGGTVGEAFRYWMAEQIRLGWPDGRNFMVLYGDPFARFGARVSRCIIGISFAGTTLAPRLAAIRKWRDKVFSRSALGRQLIRTYYKTSPYLEDAAAKSALMRTAIRFAVSKILFVLEATPSNSRI